MEAAAGPRVVCGFIAVAIGQQPAAWPAAQHVLTGLAGSSALLVAFVLGAVVGALLPSIAAFVIGVMAMAVAIAVIVALLTVLAVAIYTLAAWRAGWPQLFAP